MKVAFTPKSREDLKGIAFWIAGDSPRRAESFVTELIAAARSLGEHPLRYPDVGPRNLRRMPHGNYLIFYRVSDRVEVLPILNAARDWRALLDDAP